MDKAACDAFKADPRRNPLTGREIDTAGATFKTLVKQCKSFGVNVSPKAKAAQPAPPARPASAPRAASAAPAPTASGKRVTDLLRDKQIVFTGFRSKELEEKLATVNCKVGSSITKATALVVAKDVNETSGKLDKARVAGIRIMSREEFENNYMYGKSPRSSSASSSDVSSASSVSSSAFPEQSVVLLRNFVDTVEKAITKLQPAFDKYQQDQKQMYESFENLFSEFASSIDLGLNDDQVAALEEFLEPLDIERLSGMAEEIQERTEMLQSSFKGFKYVIKEIKKGLGSDSVNAPLEPTDPKRKPKIWFFDSMSGESDDAYGKRFITRNANKLIPGDVVAPEGGHRGDGIFIMGKNGKPVRPFLHGNGEVSLPPWVSKMLLAKGMTMSEITKIYDEGIFRFIIYPKSEHQPEELKKGLIRVFDSRDAGGTYTVSIEDEEDFADLKME